MRPFLSVLAFGLLLGLALGKDTCPPDTVFPLTTTKEPVDCDCNLCDLVFNAESQPYKTCLAHLPDLMYNSLEKHCYRLAARSDENLEAFFANLAEFCAEKEGVDIDIPECPPCPPPCECTECDICALVFNEASQPYKDCLQFLNPLFYKSLERHCYRLQAMGDKHLWAFLDNLAEFCAEKEKVVIVVPECEPWDPDACIECDPCDELLNPDGDFVLLCKHHLCPGELEIILEMCHAAVEHMSPEELWRAWDYAQEECMEHAKLTEPLNLPWCNCELCLGLFNHTDDFMMRCGSLLGDCVGDVLWPQCEYARCDPEDWHDFKKMIEYTCNEYGVEDIAFADECVCNECDLLFKPGSSFMMNCAGLLCGDTMDLVECECYNKQTDLAAWFAWVTELQETCLSYGGEFEYDLCECETKLDVMFIMDHSGTINANEFINERQFIVDVYHSFDVADDKIRVGIINFHHIPDLFIPLDIWNSEEDLNDRVPTMVQMKYGETYTGEALVAMADHFAGNDIGNRRVGIVITDGKSNGNKPVADAMEYVLEEVPHITMFAVGTADAYTPELEEIAGDNWFYVDQSDELSGVVNNLAIHVCAEGG